MDSKVAVSFRVAGDTLDPHLVTAQLGIEPSLARRRGEPLPRRSHIRQRTGVWILRSREPERASLERHLAKLLELLTPRAPEIRRLRAMGYDTNFFCGLFPPGDWAGFLLPADVLRQVSALGANLGVEIYANGEDENDDSDHRGQS